MANAEIESFIGTFVARTHIEVSELVNSKIKRKLL